MAVIDATCTGMMFFSVRGDLGLLLVSMGGSEINHVVNNQQLATDLLLIILSENNEK